ncbi:MAG: respiratory nitrate reductase subunit gamma [Pseudonocardiales bacterium]|nr:respiratory nitrate reductase subunit gamma [Pseudonocardiales bacterium]
MWTICVSGPADVRGWKWISDVTVIVLPFCFRREMRRATTRIDKVMYTLLTAAILTGMLNTVGGNLIGGGYDYRVTVSPWFRSLFTVSPHPELMANTPISFQIHNLPVLVLLAIWPYTRLVHVSSAPLGYLTRPYVVYRSRGEVLPPGARRYARAWDVSTRA